MPCVTECDDSWLSTSSRIRSTTRTCGPRWRRRDGDVVEEGCVGSGTGMQCFDFKGGIGSASRILDGDGGFTVGVLVMTNHGDREDLLIDGVRVGERLTDLMPDDHHEGSCIVVVATDAPLLPHQLRRVAERAGMGLARGGSHASNTSGEQLLAFSTANRVPPGKPFASWRATPARAPDDPSLGDLPRDGGGDRGGRAELLAGGSLDDGTRRAHPVRVAGRSDARAPGRSRPARSLSRLRRSGTDRRATRRTAAVR